MNVSYLGGIGVAAQWVGYDWSVDDSQILHTSHSVLKQNNNSNNNMAGFWEIMRVLS